MTRSTWPSSRAFWLISSSDEPRPEISVLASPAPPPLLLSLLPPQPAATTARAPTTRSAAAQPATRRWCFFIALLPSPPDCQSRAGVLGATRGGPRDPW